MFVDGCTKFNISEPNLTDLVISNRKLITTYRLLLKKTPHSDVRGLVLRSQIAPAHVPGTLQMLLSFYSDAVGGIQGVEQKVVNIPHSDLFRGVASAYNNH